MYSDKEFELGDIFEEHEPSSDLEIYAKEVLGVLISDNLPPTPNNFSVYFDRLLENKSEVLRRQIHSILELEESNDDEATINLEKNLKQGFASIKNMLNVVANLYKNINLMVKILEKKKNDIEKITDKESTLALIASLNGDVTKLNTILKKQNSQMRGFYDETAKIIKTVDKETIFDNKFGVYNKRYLLDKIEKEKELIKEFKHTSSLIMIELSKVLTEQINNEKITILMTRTMARLLLKSSRRSDIVAHYGNGMFAMLLKHTDIQSAKRASERLCELVANSNMFLADKEIHLKIAIGITDINTNYTVEEILVSAMKAIDKVYEDGKLDYAVVLRDAKQ